MLYSPIGVFGKVLFVALFVTKSHFHFICIYPRDNSFQNLIVQDAIRFAISGIDYADVTFAKVDQFVLMRGAVENYFHVIGAVIYGGNGEVEEQIERFGSFPKLTVPQSSNSYRRFVGNVANLL